ncbi:conserved hypothetical protein [Histoplasma capsulatum var. duboisii H88]|uniref:Uncharacterized protein n=1 Tax=Ajellomyces capsulatus (strain H88) TaxID=544711 RepID=F0UNY7_AJEC8|nr:conserved hypothetical protein [Histoplasma capsulatum var. duboisii H88]
MNLKNLFRADPMLATKCDGVPLSATNPYPPIHIKEASLDGNLMLLMHGIQNQAFSKTPICTYCSFGVPPTWSHTTSFPFIHYIYYLLPASNSIPDILRMGPKHDQILVVNTPVECKEQKPSSNENSNVSIRFLKLAVGYTIDIGWWPQMWSLYCILHPFVQNYKPPTSFLKKQISQKRHKSSMINWSLTRRILANAFLAPKYAICNNYYNNPHCHYQILFRPPTLIALSEFLKLVGGQLSVMAGRKVAIMLLILESASDMITEQT